MRTCCRADRPNGMQLGMDAIKSDENCQLRDGCTNRRALSRYIADAAQAPGSGGPGQGKRGFVMAEV